MLIKIDDLCGPEVAQILTEHLDDMYAVSPPESVHALDLEKLRQPEITFWSVWDGNQLAGCGAIKELDATHAEIKSMRTASAYRGKGVAVEIMEHILNVAAERNYQRLSLETGPQEFFTPARKLYERFGFEYCGPFGDYAEDPYSTFMTKSL
ncbi:MAG: GNAT family N-acetyltransferase [Pseudomonadota bacterium]|nr:GNAT family N-acetyltransferase [Pseudomonadota bacterium]